MGVINRGVIRGNSEITWAGANIMFCHFAKL
jgi:hypothetical protein